MNSVGVLIVEDDEGSAQLLRGFLEALEGVRVVGMARNGRRGLELARRERPDLVLLDLVMPEMDGISMLKVLRDDSTDVRPRVIVTSGVSTDEMVRHALRLGADDYLMKPFQAGALAERIYCFFGSDTPGGDDLNEGAAQWYLRALGAEDGPGLRYVRTIVAVLLEEGLNTPLKAAYIQAAQTHQTNYASLEIAVRRFIGTLHARSSPAYRRLLGSAAWESRPPASGVFLHALAKKILENRAR